MDSEKVIIIGAGITGLTAAYHLVKRGSRVKIIEASLHVGGLAGSLLIDGKPIEKYYHFICRGDDDLLDFINELGLVDKLHWREAGTAFFVNGITYDFNTPWDLLGFSAIPFTQRLRFGFAAFTAQHRRTWHDLDGVPGKQWLLDQMGNKAYQVIWDPLLRIKFGRFDSEVSAAWIWHRIHRVARSRLHTFGGNSYGYLEQGCSMLIDATINELKASGLCDILTGAQAKRIIIEGSRTTGVATNEGKLFPATAVISTAAIPNFLKLIPFLGDYSDRLMRIDYLNILCVLLQLKNPISNNFWLNINDARIAFNGVVETTNLNPREDLIDSHFAYIPFYLHQTDSRWSFDNNQLYQECISALRLIQPAFDEEWIRNWWIFRDDHAQAVCRVGFMDLMPSHKTPVEGLYITDSSQYYPEDRTVSASVRLGRQVADLVSNRDSKPEEL
ncbi:MAG: NAD(P)/FAD-dependent oxidoreductase [Desulfomonilaceae bacterium]